MQRVVAFVGYSGAGKTTLISNLIRRFAAEGLSIGAVKHTHHSIVGRKPHGDVEEFLEAGAKQVALADAWNAILFEKGKADPIRIFSYHDPLRLVSALAVDLVLIEGFKRVTAWPRILVNRSGIDELTIHPDEILAQVSDSGSIEGALRHQDIEGLAGVVQRVSPISELAGANDVH
jgi:molybdopterin-guanine dinucleotide biosynthesis protein B